MKKKFILLTIIMIIITFVFTPRNIVIKDSKHFLMDVEANAGFTTKCFAPEAIFHTQWPKCAEGCPYVSMKDPVQVGTCSKNEQE